MTTAGMYSHVAGLGDLLDRLSAFCLEESADLLAAAIAGRAGPDAVRAPTWGAKPAPRLSPPP